MGMSGVLFVVLQLSLLEIDCDPRDETLPTLMSLRFCSVCSSYCSFMKEQHWWHHKWHHTHKDSLIKRYFWCDWEECATKEAQEKKQADTSMLVELALHQPFLRLCGSLLKPWWEQSLDTLLVVPGGKTTVFVPEWYEVSKWWVGCCVFGRGVFLCFEVIWSVNFCSVTFGLQ